MRLDPATRDRSSPVLQSLLVVGIEIERLAQLSDGKGTWNHRSDARSERRLVKKLEWLEIA